MAKKLARIDVQSTRRMEVTRTSIITPAMSKRSWSPSLSCKVLAMPSSMLMALVSSGFQVPCTIWLCAGASVVWEILNSRSIKRCARSSV